MKTLNPKAVEILKDLRFKYLVILGEKAKERLSANPDGVTEKILHEIIEEIQKEVTRRLKDGKLKVAILEEGILDLLGDYDSGEIFMKYYEQVPGDRPEH